MKRSILHLFPWLFATVVFGLSWNSLKMDVRPQALEIIVELRTSFTSHQTLFYDDIQFAYTADRSVSKEVHPDPDIQTLTYTLPADVQRVQGIRYDPGEEPIAQELFGITLKGPYRSIHWDAEKIPDLFRGMHDLKSFEFDQERGSIALEATGGDPYFASQVDLSPFVVEVLNPTRPVIRPFVTSLLIAVVAWSCIHLLLMLRIRRLTRSDRTRILPPFGRTVLLALLTSVFTTFILNNINFQERRIHIDLELVATVSDNFQLFFAQKPGDFHEGNFVNVPVIGSSRIQILSFPMPQDTMFSHLRFDPGNMQDSLLIKAMSIRCNDRSRRYSAAELYELFHPNEQVATFDLTDRGSVLHFKGNDPFLFSDRNLGPEVKSIWERSGNGPLPWIFGIITGAFILFRYWRTPILTAADKDLRGNEWALAILFTLLISMPTLSELMPIQPFLEDTEKRPTAEKPLLRMHSLLEFPDKYAKFFSDHFGFRRALFRMNAFFHAYVLKDSSMPDHVIFGKDDFLFLNRPGAVDLYRGLPAFTNDELKEVGERLEKRRHWLAERGIDYYLYFPPLKATIYPDKLPDAYMPVRDTSALDLLIQHLQLHTKIPIIDSRAELLAGRKVRDTYYTTDMHWNPWGALIGYQKLLSRIALDNPEVGQPCIEEDYVVEAVPNDQGDLAMQIAMNDKLTRVTYMMVPLAGSKAEALPEETLPASAFFKYKPIFMKGPDPKAPKLLMFRDSFSVYLIPYLSEHFSRSVYVWSPIFIPDIVEQEKPDIVVHEILELFMTDLLEDKLRPDL
ncbi:MAG: hypothetical protein KBA60_06505 [Flavobacteriales bacterium]|nr:hypothetical protein [Flavobacteriales bacterium]